MPDTLLTILKFCFLAILYLFFIRVLRAVWAELRGVSAPAPAAAAPAPRRAPAPRGPWGNRNGTRLRVVEPADRRGSTYELGEELTLGRAGGCQVTIDDTYVSQLHARLFLREGQYYVEDLGSTNGTYLNGVPLSGPQPLHDGDRIRIGDSEFTFVR